QMPVELDPWESIVLYKIEPEYDYANGHTVPANTQLTWLDEELTIKGSVVVENGATLTIENSTIYFADSRQEGVETNIVVEEGGTLNLNNAHLTTLEYCGSQSMWDGIKVLGGPETSTAYINVQFGSRISNALTGVLCGQGDPMS